MNRSPVHGFVKEFAQLNPILMKKIVVKQFQVVMNRMIQLMMTEVVKVKITLRNIMVKIQIMN